MGIGVDKIGAAACIQIRFPPTGDAHSEKVCIRRVRPCISTNIDHDFARCLFAPPQKWSARPASLVWGRWVRGPDGRGMEGGRPPAARAHEAHDQPPYCPCGAALSRPGAPGARRRRRLLLPVAWSSVLSVVVLVLVTGLASAADTMQNSTAPTAAGKNSTRPARPPPAPMMRPDTWPEFEVPPGVVPVEVSRFRNG